MPEPRRRAACRSLIDGVFIYERIRTTDARAKAVHGEAESLIATAIRGHNDAWAHLKSVVEDDYLAEQVLALARRARFTLDERIASNEERAAQGKFPLSAEARKLKQDRLAAFQKEAPGLFNNRDAAEAALPAARQALVGELHARRTSLNRLPHRKPPQQIHQPFSARQ